jgi:competence protein ComEC
LANLLAVPIMSLTVIPLFLLASLLSYCCVDFATYLFELGFWLFEFLWSYLEFLAGLSWAGYPISEHLFLIIGLTLCVAGSLFFLSKMHKGYGIVCLTILPLVTAVVINRQANINDSQWSVTTLDVGHGLAVIIEKNDKAILYDTGARYPSGFNLAQAVIHPFMNTEGIKAFDYGIISHSDNDHAGGLGYLLEQSLVDQLITNIEILPEQEFRRNFCSLDNDLVWQGLRFEFIWAGNFPAAENDDSCVVLISDANYKVMLSGDISKKVEKQLLVAGKLTAVDLLVAPHHGSKSSSSPVFVKRLKPDIVVFSSGYLNHWQMPLPEVVNRYHNAGSKSYITARDGMIITKFSNSGVETLTYRNDLMPYWFVN